MEWNWKDEADKGTTEENKADGFFFDWRNKLAIALQDVAKNETQEGDGAEEVRPNIAGLVVILEDCFQAGLKLWIVSN